MADRFVKHIPTGQVFIYQGAFATRDDFEECADAAGNPIGLTIEGTAVRVEDPVKHKGRKPREVAAQESINAEASRGL